MGAYVYNIKYVNTIDGESMTLEQCYEKHGRLIYVGVKKVIRGTVPYGCEMDDIVSVGTEAFIKAFYRFRSDKGARFSTYAIETIKGSIRVYLSRVNPLIRRSRRATELRYRLGEDLWELTAKEIAEKYGITIKEVHEVREQYGGYTSLDQAVLNDDEDEGSHTLHDVSGKPEDYSIIYINDFKRFLRDRQKKILDLILDGKSQVDIAKTVKVSQPEVSREIRRIRQRYEEWEKLSYGVGK